MRKENNTPHIGMIVALGAIIAAVWLLAIYGTYKEAIEEKYDVTVRPGAVSYGTHSSATVPMVSAPARHASVPMISGGEVRSYARSGHADYAIHPTPYTIQTTSSATVHTVGSGEGASGGLSSSPSGDRGASSRGITYGGASVSMPTLALVTPVYATTPTNIEEAVRQGAKPRRAPTGDGTWEGQTYSDDDGLFVWDGEGWTLSIPDGTTKVEGGMTYVYHNGWQLLENQGDPGLPLGDAPWHWLLLLALTYGITKIVRRKQNAIQ